MSSNNNKALVLTALMIGLIFTELDETIVSTAMPTIIRQLHGLSLYGWVAGIYMLSLTLFMPILGKLADLYGRKRIYLLCMGLFIGGSVVSGCASSMAVLLLGRGIQGIGAGGLMPLALVIIDEAFPLEQRARIQSLFGPLMILPQLLGPTLGGYIVDRFNWHWVFLINLPVGMLAALLLAKGLRESRSDEKRSIDWAGAGALMLGLLSLLLAPVLVDNQGYAWSSPVVLSLLAAAVLILALFIGIERRAAEPIIPLHLFRNRNVVVLSSLVFTLMLGIMGGVALFPFFMQNVMDLSPTASGYLNLSFMLGAIPTSIAFGFMITKFRYRTLFILFMMLPIVGFALLSRIDIHTGVPYVIAAFVIIGVGMGSLFGGDNLIVQESVESRHSGVALSTVQLFQSLGATIGLSVFGSLLSARISRGVAPLAEQLPPGSADNLAAGGIPAGISPTLITEVKTVFADAFQNMFTISLGFVVVTFLICWFLKKEVLTPKKEGEAEAA